MVTRIVVLRILTPAERASAAEDSNRDDDDNDDQLYHKERVNDVKYDIKNHGEEIQLCSNSERSCLTDDEAADGGLCDGHSQNNNDVSSLCKSKDDTIDEGTAVEINELDTSTSNKRPLLLEDDADDNGKNKRQRKRQQKFIDLTDVPPQSPIKSKRSDSSSKYEGVTFNKTMNNWRARISVDGKTQYNIGSYDNEEEAAIDYARAVFKYKAGIAGGKRKQKFIDLTDVPPQSPIKSKRSDSSSKYEGVTFNKTMNNWRARISVDGKTQYNIGSYDNEEEAAIDYARAAYKYKAGITTRRASLLATGSVAIPRSAGRLSFPFATVGVSNTGVERLAMKEAEINSATDEVVSAAMAALHRHRGDAEETHNTVDYGSDAPSDLRRHNTTPSSSQLDVMTEAFLERSIARKLQSRRESGLLGSNFSMTAFLARIGSCDSQAVMADMGAKAS